MRTDLWGKGQADVSYLIPSGDQGYIVCIGGGCASFAFKLSIFVQLQAAVQSNYKMEGVE